MKISNFSSHYQTVLKALPLSGETTTDLGIADLEGILEISEHISWFLADLPFPLTPMDLNLLIKTVYSLLFIALSLFITW